MKTKKESIIDNIFKTLHVFENEGYKNYHAHLDTVIIELSGEEPQEVLERSIIALKGLYNQQEDITHKQIRKIVLRCTNKISREFKGE